MFSKFSISFVIPRVYLYFHPEISESPGGSERQAFYLGKGLSIDKNYGINYCVADYGQEGDETHEQIKLWKSFNFQSNSLFSLLTLFKVLKKINADLYIFRAASLGTAATAFFVKYFLRKKMLYMVAHDEETQPVSAPKTTIGKIGDFLMGFVYRFADILTVQSTFQKDEMIRNRKAVPSGIIKNIYNIRLQLEDMPLENRELMLWVGRCVEFKQPHIYIELARRNPGHKFVMICPASPFHKDLFENTKSEANKVNNLEFIDFVEPHKISEYYKKAMIYVTTSTSEGFANTMMEAMEAMCPILSLNINPDNIIDNYEMGLYTKDIDEFYANFHKLANDLDMRKRMGTNARKYLEENHDQDAILEEFKAIISNNLTP